METIYTLIAVGLLMLLVLLRLQAPEFGAAEYDETFDGEPSRFRNRLAWYAIGLALIAAIYFIHPHPRDDLALVSGRRVEALVYGTGFAMLGVAQAVVFALFRYGDLRLPPLKAYPGAALNTIATAFIDEATFRGILLGLMLVVGVNSTVAVLVQAILYALATRLGASGRHPYMLAVALAIGLIGGYVTIRTGGIGAAFFGHAVTSYALFVCTGHAGQVFRRGEEPEEEDFVRRPPSGWRDARAPFRRGHGAEPKGVPFDDGTEPTLSTAAGAAAEGSAARRAATHDAARRAAGHDASTGSQEQLPFEPSGGLEDAPRAARSAGFDGRTGRDDAPRANHPEGDHGSTDRAVDDRVDRAPVAGWPTADREPVTGRPTVDREPVAGWPTAESEPPADRAPLAERGPADRAPDESADVSPSPAVRRRSVRDRDLTDPEGGADLRR